MHSRQAVSNNAPASREGKHTDTEMRAALGAQDKADLSAKG